jgi:hypothetical protein
MRTLGRMGMQREYNAHFEEQVLRKRPYIQRNWCQDVVAAPIRREFQADGRIRFWGRVRCLAKSDHGPYES